MPGAGSGGARAHGVFDRSVGRPHGRDLRGGARGMTGKVSPRAWAAVAAALLTAVFLLSWWNRFLGGTGVDSVFLFAARELLQGRMPYRDFDLVVPPFEVFKSA